jgi:hypothetical protein
MKRASLLLAGLMAALMASPGATHPLVGPAKDAVAGLSITEKIADPWRRPIRKRELKTNPSVSMCYALCMRGRGGALPDRAICRAKCR